MAKRGYQPEQIISKLREVEILLSYWAHSTDCIPPY